MSQGKSPANPRRWKTLSTRREVHVHALVGATSPLVLDELSRRRCEAVRSLLTRLGIPAEYVYVRDPCHSYVSGASSPFFTV